MICGVDSYLTTLTIAHYLAERRLLTPDNPNGFIPGEAAAAILCARPGRGPLRLLGLGLAREPAYIYNPEADLAPPRRRHDRRLPRRPRRGRHRSGRRSATASPT